ncbi:hypothetical protein HYALB_00009168 [Hymenoscyphus albidus]|uniref:Uncharacterized protein n=1 Tax=Hymenoscyphus albidus TaxID=595503 RepID=A0A9N9Q0Y4_9HELO|nr:hypothetical protein HYALB_00009168 [Hymenoscyphus albidus]
MSTQDRLGHLNWMRSRGERVFHEMTHLAIVENRYPRLVTDLPANPVDGLGLLVYGPRMTENLASKFPDYAYLNGTDMYQSKRRDQETDYVMLL